MQVIVTIDIPHYLEKTIDEILVELEGTKRRSHLISLVEALVISEGDSILMVEVSR